MPDDGTKRIRTPILALFAATLTSQLSAMLAVVALPWFVLQTTESPARTGLVGFALLAPRFIAGVFGSVFVDQFGYRRVIIALDSDSTESSPEIPVDCCFMRGLSTAMGGCSS